MRKLAILAVILLIVATVLVTISVFNVGGFRDAAGGAIEGTILAPFRTGAINLWLAAGANFTYVAAATLIISVVGGLFLVFIIYGLFWKKLIQQKLLHKTPQPTDGPAPLQSSMSTQISASEPMQTKPAAVATPTPQSTVKEETAQT
jgi:hypothetical protein